MYISRLKTAIVEALLQTFADSHYPNRDFAEIKVGIEYPLAKQQYPSIWVNYDDRDALEIASIDHREYVHDEQGQLREITRWTFAGTVTLTAVALSSLERDNLFDELVRIYAFSKVENHTAVRFRDLLDNNPFLVLRVNWDQARPGGDAAAPGTPWGTDDEVIYEKTLSFDIEGDFVSDLSQTDIVPLSAITVAATLQALDGGETLTGQILIGGSPEPAFDPTQWH